MKRAAAIWLALLLLISLLPQTAAMAADYSSASFAPYSGSPYVTVNGNVPYFTEEEKKGTYSFEVYYSLDFFGRCTKAYARIGTDLMPTSERENISSVKPSGWQTDRYDFIDGEMLYNRCHLIGFQLTGENANRKNLITGTRYLNVSGMLPFENMTAEYIRSTKHHVLYRVTPVFDGFDLLARGVLIEAWSVEDDGKGLCFCVYCYNVQPGVSIDYATGISSLIPVGKRYFLPGSDRFVLNTNTKKFHLPECGSASSMSAKNRKEYVGTASYLIANGYEPCSRCHPDQKSSGAEFFYYGDVDLDGAITSSDARLTLRQAVGAENLSALQKTLADTDFDGRIMASDARLVLRVSVGLHTIT